MAGSFTDAIPEALTPYLTACFCVRPITYRPAAAGARQLLQATAVRCKSLNINLILDEAFTDIPHETGFIPALKDNPHIWVLRSLFDQIAIPACG